MPRQPPEEPLVLLTIKVPASLAADVKTIAKARRETVSDVVRGGLRRYRKRHAIHLAQKKN